MCTKLKTLTLILSVTDNGFWNTEFENPDPPVNVLYMPSDVIGFGGRGTGFVTLLTNTIFFWSLRS